MAAQARRMGAGARARAAAPRAVLCAAKKAEGMGSADNPTFLPGFGKQNDKVNQASLDPSKRLATKDVNKSPFQQAGYQDSGGSKGKGKGVFQFSSKYGGNIDTYAPIYNPQTFGDDFVTGMSERDFAIFMAFLAPVFLSLPLAIALKGYGII